MKIDNQNYARLAMMRGKIDEINKNIDFRTEESKIRQELHERSEKLKNLSPPSKFMGYVGNVKRGFNRVATHLSKNSTAHNKDDFSERFNEFTGTPRNKK
jgi:hypothetical protein